MADSERTDLLQLCESGRLFEKVGEYIDACGKERFPNIAGFCRSCGVGQGELELLLDKYPREYDALCAVFEDEALNSGVAVTLIGAYMKKRLGYGDEKKSGSQDEVPEVVFKHDIFKDGE